jgi:hypothetical protein
MKGIHNTVADAISRLDYDPKLNSTNEYNHATHVMSMNKEACQNWLMCSKFWSCYNKMQGGPDKTNTIQTNQVFTNHSKEDELYPLTVKDIVEAQKANTKLKHLFKSNAVLDKGLELQLIKNKSCICHKGWHIIPKPLQSYAVMWYHHYLQHPGHTRLEETMKAAT